MKIKILVVFVPHFKPEKSPFVRSYVSDDLPSSLKSQITRDLNNEWDLYTGFTWDEISVMEIQFRHTEVEF